MGVIWMTFATIALSIASAAPTIAPADPPNLKDYGLICFCTARTATPHRLVKADNNGRILLLARNGVTKPQIVAAGEPVSDSQLQALQDWGLLAQKDDRFTTSFPILGSTQMAALRARLEPISTDLSRKIAPDIKAVQTELHARGQSKSMEAVLFGYILDGLTWRALEEAKALPAQDLDVEHPYWNGAFWAVFPKQETMPGTNSQTEGKTEIRMMWTQPVLPWFERLARGGGASALPGAVVVRETSADTIYVRGRAASAHIASAVMAANLDDVIPSADAKQRVLIATHELIWMLLDRANRDLGLKAPAVLKDGATTLQDVTPLVVVIERADTP